MSVRYTGAFQRQLKRLSRHYRRIRQDIQPMIDRLVAGEVLGDRIQGIGECIYKVRVKNTDANRGTRGGFRIIYYLSVEDGYVLLLTIYSKTEQGDIAIEDLQRIIAKENAGK